MIIFVMFRCYLLCKTSLSHAFSSIYTIIRFTLILKMVTKGNMNMAALPLIQRLKLSSWGICKTVAVSEKICNLYDTQ